MHKCTGQGARIRERRKATGLTQEKLAHRIDVTRNTVALWEKGGGIDGAHLVRLADELGVTARWILTGESRAA